MAAFPSGNHSHLAAFRSVMSIGSSFSPRSQPIHFARCQSSALSRPIDQNAGSLQGEACPRSSQNRTFHQHCDRARERLAVVGYVDRLLRFRLVRSSRDRRDPASSSDRSAGDQHLIGRLPQPAAFRIGGRQLPAQSGMQVVDPQGIDQIIAAEIAGRGHVGRRRCGERQQLRRCQRVRRRSRPNTAVSR